MQNQLVYSFMCLLFITITANVDQAHSEDTSTVDDCNTSENNSTNHSIDTVSVTIHPIFDESNPKENTWLFRAVNSLHIKTRESVIKDDLLFKEGDLYNAKLLEQSERILRTRRYLNYAFISPSPDCQSTQRVNVDVREVWTLVPELTFSRAGGNMNYGVGLRDSNFLGLGKTVNFKHTSTSHRTGNLFQYYDPNTGIADSTVELQYANNSDGVAKSAALIKPFAAFEAQWSAGVSYSQYDQEDTLYDAGKEVNRFAHSNLNTSLFYGLKLDAGNDESIHRFLFGYTQWRDSFLPTGVAPSASIFVPNDREFNYPWIEYQHITDDYIKAYNIQQINRTEDINFGAEIRFRLGYASSPLSDYDKSYVFNSDYEKAISLSERQLILTHASAGGYYRAGDFYNGKVQGKVSYHWQNFNRGQFFVGLTAARGFDLFKDLPFELGGDTGLRGYPARYQAGDRFRLISVEQRFFGEKEWFSLFHIGAAVFYDEGRVWGESAIPQSQTTVLRDVGVGLRISGTRTGNREEGAHNILHIDIAAPLDGSKDISKLQWIIKVKKGF